MQQVAYDIVGLERSRYLCATNYTEDYWIQGSPNCDGRNLKQTEMQVRHIGGLQSANREAGGRFTDIPAPLEPLRSEWYLVCGCPHDDFVGFMAVVCSFSGLGAAAFAVALSQAARGT
jgi:hypothetical protein